MDYQPIPKQAWRPFFEDISKVIEGRFVELAVMALDLGDQIESDKMSLTGISYDEKDDALYIGLLVGATGATRHLDHVIFSPQEIYVDVSDIGFTSVAVMEASGQKQLVGLRVPLKLPEVGTPDSPSQARPTEEQTLPR